MSYSTSYAGFAGAVRIATMLCVATTMTIAAGAALAWQTAHGDPDNTGAVDVRTARAVSPRATVGLGEIAPGAGPVIAPDGTVYVGNMDGTLTAFDAQSGQRLWDTSLKASFSAPNLTVAEGRLFVGSTAGTVLQVADGKVIREP